MVRMCLGLRATQKDGIGTMMVRGDLTAGPEAVDDLVLIKADGYPTYNFCHIVDDFEMGITHILRTMNLLVLLLNF
jgi:glutamyl/glutaminyl-tRNA synthetase